MIKIIVDLKNIDNITKYDCDGLIVSSERFSCYNDRCFSFEEIKRIVLYCKEHNIYTILNVDKIIEEDELDLLYKTLDQYIKLDIDYYIYGDFAVFTYFKKHDLLKKLIYDPKTMITNYEEAKIHRNYGSLVSVSNELTFYEIKDIVEVGNAILEVYGYHQMFYSRRHVLSTYANFQEKQRILDKKLLTIKEELREERYPIFESDHGTFVYTNYRYCMFKELLRLDKLNMIKINSMFIDEEEILKVLHLYKKLLNGEGNVDEVYQELMMINPNISGGFLNKKSFLLKEEE